jgi:hypothetical protein
MSNRRGVSPRASNMGGRAMGECVSNLSDIHLVRVWRSNGHMDRHNDVLRGRPFLHSAVI